MITTAMIMGAGIGSRFGHYTECNPKGFVEIGGKPMIVRAIETLLSCGITRIVIGTGYMKDAYEALKKDYPMIETCYSPLYARTNSMYTLYNTRELLGTDDFLLLESDLIFEKKAIQSLQECEYPNVMLITPVTKFQDQYYVEYNEQHVLTACSTNKHEVDAKGELVGIHKLSSRFFKDMCSDYANMLTEYPKLGYEYQLLRMSRNKHSVYVLNVPHLKWYEIDDESDLQYAELHILPFTIN